MLFRSLLLLTLSVAPALAVMQGEPLHSLMENAALAAQNYGPKHPRVLALNTEIDRRLNQGERIDVEAIEKRLVDLVQERSDLRRRFGSRHPKTIDNARRLYAVSGLLISAE